MKKKNSKYKNVDEVVDGVKAEEPVAAAEPGIAVLPENTEDANKPAVLTSVKNELVGVGEPVYEVPSMSAEDVSRIEKFSAAVHRVRTELSKDVVGMSDIVDNVLCAIVAGGNVLLEGVPGVGKTRLVRALGRTMSLTFSRIQFTPDLMP